MRKRWNTSTLVVAILLSLLPLLHPFTTSGEESRKEEKRVKEYRLGEILIKGEKEKPQVYFIIPKAKFSLQNIPLNDDIIREISEADFQIK